MELDVALSRPLAIGEAWRLRDGFVLIIKTIQSDDFSAWVINPSGSLSPYILKEKHLGRYLADRGGRRIEHPLDEGELYRGPEYYEDMLDDGDIDFDRGYEDDSN